LFVELHSRSAFSFLEGSTLPEDLISVCASKGMTAMALLDRDGLYGSPRFYLAAKKIDLKAHIGAEVSCEASPGQNLSPQRHRGTERTRRKENSEFAEDPHPSQNTWHSSLNDCHPDNDCHPERSEGPAFPPRTPPPSANLPSAIKNLKSADFRLPLLVASRYGYQNLCQLITRMKLRAPQKETGAVLEHELEHHAEGLICLTGCAGRSAIGRGVRDESAP